MKNVIIWGNHSSTQFPDVAHATVDQDGKTVPVYDAVADDAWLQGEFIQVCSIQYMFAIGLGPGLGVLCAHAIAYVFTLFSLPLCQWCS